MHFKESLQLIGRSDIGKMKECLVTETDVNNEICFLTCLKVLRS